MQMKAFAISSIRVGSSRNCHSARMPILTIRKICVRPDNLPGAVDAGRLGDAAAGQRTGDSSVDARAISKAMNNAEDVGIRSDNLPGGIDTRSPCAEDAA